MCAIVVFLSQFNSLSGLLATHFIACADVPISCEQWYEATGILAYIEQILSSSVGLRKALSCVCNQEEAPSLLGQAQLLKVKLLVKEIETMSQEDGSSCETVVTKEKFITPLASAVKAIKRNKAADGSDINPKRPKFELEAFQELHSVVWLLLHRSIMEAYPVPLEGGKWLHSFIYEQFLCMTFEYVLCNKFWVELFSLYLKTPLHCKNVVC